jgi:uncharacterized protein (TIGR00251 family)
VSALRIVERDGAVRVAVRVQPRASRSEIVGVHGDALKVRLAAPPVDGAANDALVALLSSAFAIPRRAVRILAGESSRSKLVEIDGVSPEAVLRLADRGALITRSR